MQIPNIPDPIAWIERRGNLHDVELLAIDWKTVEKRLGLSLNDVWANYVGFPEYAGPEPVLIEFDGVAGLEISVEQGEGRVAVYDVEIVTLQEGGYCCKLHFSIIGRIEFRFQAMLVQKLPSVANN